MQNDLKVATVPLSFLDPCSNSLRRSMSSPAMEAIFTFVLRTSLDQSFSMTRLESTTGRWLVGRGSLRLNHSITSPPLSSPSPLLSSPPPLPPPLPPPAHTPPRLSCPTAVLCRTTFSVPRLTCSAVGEEGHHHGVQLPLCPELPSGPRLSDQWYCLRCACSSDFFSVCRCSC
jgi:hypothetical protein